MTCELIQLNQSYQCHLDDYFGTKMFFVSQSNLQPGPVKMHMSFLYLEHSEIVVMEGKIISLEAGFIGVEIKPSDIFTFMPFMRIYNERQDNIKIFMKLASGQ